MKKNNSIQKRLLALMLCVATVCTTLLGGLSVNAATTVTYDLGRELTYGTLWTNFMTFDGDNIAYCIEPELYAPESGTYTVQILSEGSALRKALYYLYGGYGYEKVTKEKYFSGWSKDDIYIVGHLVVSYINDGYSSGDDAFLGATQKYIEKAIEVANGIKNLSEPHKSFKAWIRDGGDKQTLIGSWYSKPMGYVEITKYSANESVSDGNENYSLAGAKYGIYSGDVLVATMTTDENGYAKSGELEVGSYVIKEMTASKGYALDVNSYQVEVVAEETTSKKVPETPQVNPLSIVLQKVDTETGNAEAQGKASLENAEFTVKYYETQSDSDPAKAGEEPLKTWIFKTDKNGQIEFTKEYLVSGDDFDTQVDGTTLCVPLGTVTIQETKAPTGYKLNEKVYVQKITSEGTKEVVNVYQAPTVGDQVYRGDLKLVKVSDSSLERLANVPFKITSVTTGESHVIVTDENGYADTSASWNPHTQNTNAGKTSKDGVWFGTSDPDDSKGALLYDEYIIEELRCEANEGMNLLKFDVSVYKDSTTIDLGTLTNDKIDIATTAMDEDTEINMSMADEKVTLIDTVEYENLKKGQTYKVVGTLMDKATGKELLVNGKKVTAEATFKTKLSTGSVDVTFEFDGSGLKGKTIVVFEELYQEDLLLAVHADIEDEDQTIYFPEIGTTATDSETEIGLSKADEKVTIIDTVEYENLLPNKEYKVSGVLMDQETGEELLVNGKKITSEQTFKPKSSSGTVEMTFTFDATGMGNESVVVFETVTYKDKKVAVHADIEDEGQTVHIPEIGTTATDSDTTINVSKADEEVTIVDKVAYKNLVPNKKYKVIGILMDKETGEPFRVNGKEVTVEKTFTAKKSNGTVEVSFTINGAALAGESVVVFETMYYNNIEVAIHADINDEGQTIHFPEIGTTALDSETEENVSKADEEVTIVDNVEYKNLVPGKEYKVTGVLVDKEIGEPLLVGEIEVTAETTFTPEKANGTVEVTFVFDGAALAGKTVVAFETMTYEGKEVAVHSDIEDEVQTVHFPEIGTTAIDSDTEDQLSKADEEVTIIDTVEYKNLVLGKEYKLVGVLMDKATGEAVLVDEKEVTAETVFTPEEADGTVEVKFVFNGSALKGKTVVVFESMYLNEKEVAVHADIEDEGQTIYFPEIGTTAKDNETDCSVVNPDEEVTIVDVVKYQNLIPGKEYKVTGVLMDKETEEALLVNGKEVTAEATFTPEKADGEVEVSFTFDASALKGKAVVAFETVTYEEKEVAVHADIEDEAQTVYFPKIETTAKDADDSDQKAVADEKVTIVDTVAYENLEAERTYKVVGVLMDKVTGKEIIINGKQVTSETEFLAKESSGSVEVTFTFNAKGLAGKSVVVFEKMYLVTEEEELLIATHEDIADEGQTVKLTEKPAEKGPKTGDDSNVRVWLVLGGMAALLISVRVLKYYKTSNKKKNK